MVHTLNFPSHSCIRLLHIFVLLTFSCRFLCNHSSFPTSFPLIPIYSRDLSTAPVLSVLLLQYLPCFRLLRPFPFLQNIECIVSSLHRGNVSITQSGNELKFIQVIWQPTEQLICQGVYKLLSQNEPQVPTWQLHCN
jgi:hypothetical protein